MSRRLSPREVRIQLLPCMALFRIEGFRWRSVPPFDERGTGVSAAGRIRRGMICSRYPATFPSLTLALWIMCDRWWAARWTPVQPPTRVILEGLPAAHGAFKVENICKGNGRATHEVLVCCCCWLRRGRLQVASAMLPSLSSSLAASACCSRSSSSGPSQGFRSAATRGTPPPPHLMLATTSSRPAIRP